MPRIATQTALATILGLSFALPAAAQSGAQDCLPATFATGADGDGDGVISAAEAEAAAEREFASFDADEDDSISREEFIGCYAWPTAGTGGEQAAADTGQESAGTEAEPETAAADDDRDITHEEDVTITRTEENFARADLNQDGSIDRAEFGLGAQQAFDEALALGDEAEAEVGEQTPDPGPEDQVVTEQAVPGVNMAEEVLTDEALALVDGESPGDPGERAPQIVRERYLDSPYADWRTMQDRGLTPDEIAFTSAQLFGALDADGDDALDLTEWMRVAPVAELGPEELGRIFDGVDADGDAIVSLPEYVEAVLAHHAEALAAVDAVSPQAAQARDQTSEATETETATQGGVPVFVYRIYRF